MRILFVTANFRPHVGGIERFVEVLAGGLAGRGHDVTVICCRYDRAPLDEMTDGFRVLRVPASYVLEQRVRVPYPLPEPMALVRRLRSELRRADVLHVQDAVYATSVVALGLARTKRVPSVVTQHVPFVPQHSGWLNSVERLSLSTLGRSSKLATIVATLNPSVAEWVESTWGLRGVRVMPVGIPPLGSREGDRAETRRSFGLPADRFLALFVGRDVPKKGLDIFLAATADEYDLVAVTDRLDAPHGATILPFMSPDRVFALMSCVDAFVVPSSAGEGFPIVLQEALASGLPVVTTAGAGYDHYLEPGDVLLVERTADAVRAGIRSLVEDDELRVSLAERALAAAAREFGVEPFISAYEQLYREAVDSFGASHRGP